MSDFPNPELEEAIVYHTEDLDFKLQQTDNFSNWIEMIIQKEAGELKQLNFIFCSDTYLHQMNVEYLNHDTLTDVITFPYAQLPIIEGDIFISIERIKENATLFNTTFLRELARVMIHGVLHLCGYGDKNEVDQKIMTSKENSSLEEITKYGIDLAEVIT